MNHRALTLRTPLTLLTLLASTTLLPACDTNPSSQEHGSLEITTSAATAEKGFTSTDGWTVKLNHFFVDVTALNVGGLDGVVTASATSQIFDQVAPGPKPLLSATVRAARPWEDVNFEIGPAVLTASVPPTFLAPVTQADVDMMVKDGLSLYVDGTATLGAVTKKFTWAFTTDTLNAQCTGDVDGVAVPGLVVPAGGDDSADIGMRTDVLFSDSLVATGMASRFDPIAAADADKDGNVTLDELAAVTLDSLHAAKAGPYDVAMGSPIVDLRAFTEELTRHVVSSFRAKGSCTPSAAPPAAAQ